MLVLNSPTELKPLNLANIVCALGVFDGVHLGHKRVLSAVVRNAKEINGTSVVITFDKHPYAVLNPSYKVPLLTSTPHKLQLLEEIGIDACILIKFNKDTASITAEDWIKEILWEQIHAKNIYIGRDSFFGKDRKGNADLLRSWGNRLGFKTNIIDAVRINRLPVSSTLIRDNIQSGNIEAAKEFLGRDYSVRGTVVKGTGKGKELGFPTANLDTQDQCLPLGGVYAAWVKIGDKPKPAVANIGKRPTIVKTTTPILEVHLLEGAAELYNKSLEVIFIKRLRDEIKFDSISHLKNQIEKDITQAKEILGKEIGDERNWGRVHIS